MSGTSGSFAERPQGSLGIIAVDSPPHVPDTRANTPQLEEPISRGGGILRPQLNVQPTQREPPVAQRASVEGDESLLSPRSPGTPNRRVTIRPADVEQKEATPPSPALENDAADEVDRAHGLQEGQSYTQHYIANPKKNLLRESYKRNLRRNDLSGWYFHDVPVDYFKANMVRLKTTVHPDRVLRLVGLIRQTGKTGWLRTRVNFDAVFRRWKVTELNKTLEISEKQVYEREDHVPRGLIHVIGQLSIQESERVDREREAQRNAVNEELQQFSATRKNMVDSATGGKEGSGSGSTLRNRRGTASKASVAFLNPAGSPLERERSTSSFDRTSSLRGSPSRASSSMGSAFGSLTHTGGGATSPRATSHAPEYLRPWESYTGYDTWDDCDGNFEKSLIEVGDPSPNFLSVTEQLRFIRHYLSRAVVAAAFASGSSILTGGSMISLDNTPAGTKPTASSTKIPVDDDDDEGDEDDLYQRDRSKGLDVPFGPKRAVQPRALSDDIERLLGIGYAAMADQYNSKQWRQSEVPTQLIGVSTAMHPAISLHYTHRLILQGGSTHQILAYQPRRIGVGGQCSLCGKDIEGDEVWKTCPGYGSIDKPPTRLQLAHFKLSLLEAMQNGFQRQLLQRPEEAPPNRDGVPITAVLCGGDFVSREEAYLAVVRRWPLIVLEGSGGFADVVCNVRKEAERVAPDDLRSALSNVDHKTAEVASYGRLLIIHKGTEVARFQRVLQDSLKGDETLFKAWRHYSMWYKAELKWSYYHSIFELMVLMLSILSTASPVCLTFMKLLWQSEDQEYIDRWAKNIVLADERWIYLVYVTLEWLVIFFPIALSLVIAIQQRRNPWRKVVALRTAANSMLKHIYLYRTQTLGYSTEAIRRQQQKVADLTKNKDRQRD